MITAQVEAFLASPTIAVVGVSDKRPTGCNLAWHRLRDTGHHVLAVNPHQETWDGQPCYPDLASLPEKPDAVFLFTRPEITDRMIDQCVALGVKRVWMHGSLGTKPGLGAGHTSVSAAAVAKCREAGIDVIPGGCPNAFVNPDLFHAGLRWVTGAVGWLA